jgi:hypothetical protein
MSTGIAECKRGHMQTAENVYVSPKGQRHCRPCKRVRDAYRVPSEARRAAGRERAKRHYRENKERHRAQMIKWAADNPEAARRNYLRYRLKAFGLTEAQYFAMVAEQDDRCKICGNHEERHDKRGVRYLLSVDHCHATGKVRGLLCQECNKGLGAFDDDPARLRAAADYLLGGRRGSGIEDCAPPGPD